MEECRAFFSNSVSQPSWATFCWSCSQLMDQSEGLLTQLSVLEAELSGIRFQSINGVLKDDKNGDKLNPVRTLLVEKMKKKVYSSQYQSSNEQNIDNSGKFCMEMNNVYFLHEICKKLARNH